MIQLEHAQIEQAKVANRLNGGVYEKLSKSVDTSILLDVKCAIWWPHSFLKLLKHHWHGDYLKSLHRQQIRCWK